MAASLIWVRQWVPRTAAGSEFHSVVAAEPNWVVPDRVLAFGS